MFRMTEHSPDINHYLFVRDERKRYTQLFKHQVLVQLLPTSQLALLGLIKVFGGSLSG